MILPPLTFFGDAMQDVASRLTTTYSFEAFRLAGIYACDAADFS